VSARDFRCFFTTGTGWGVFSQRLSERTHDARLDVRYGEVRLRTLDLGSEAPLSKLSVASASGPGVEARRTRAAREGEGLRVDFGRELVIGEGQSLSVSLAFSRSA
jgi:hypothetical protein